MSFKIYGGQARDELRSQTADMDLRKYVQFVARRRGMIGSEVSPDAAGGGRAFWASAGGV